MTRSSLILLVLLAACADPARNLYEGMQQREAIANPHATSNAKKMDYDQYEAERNKIRGPAGHESATSTETSR